jgi:RNA polymerase sigma-70 factor, ECF subfamily
MTGARGAQPAWSAAERAAREAYGRLVASLAWRWRDLAAAEDALAGALLTALETWPRDGVPDSPEAWLTVAARRNLLQGARHRRLELDPAVTVLLEIEAAVESEGGLPDNRLELMFVCADPRIDEKLRTPLMLQAVLGMDAARIASAFLVSPSAMAQRLVRAKQRIRGDGLRFERPLPDELPQRLGAVLEGIYGAYGAGWSNGSAPDGGELDRSGEDFATEAIYLARVAAAVLPDEPEALGLLALLLSSHARSPARLGPQGQFVPLTEQDPLRWDAAAIVEADQLLLRASALRRPGPFQLEAAIQSAHCQRRYTGSTPWSGIVALYRALAAIAPTVSVRIGFAVALVETGELAQARALLDALPDTVRNAYQPWWAARWHLERRGGDRSLETAALQRAIGLTKDPAVRDWLQQQQAG